MKTGNNHTKVIFECKVMAEAKAKPVKAKP